VDGERAAGQMASIWQRWQARPTWWGGRRMSLLVHTGRLTVVAVRWRRRYQLVRQELRVVRLRLQTPWRIAYYVLPAGLRGRRKHEAATDAQAVAPRARIIVNRSSGSVHGAFGLNELAETAKWLGAHGFPAEVRETAYAGHAEVLAREAARAGMDLVIAAGGDGTVNSVVQGLAGTQTALAVLPMGTVNVWAREVGIPLPAALAREVVLNGVRRRVDLGRAGSRYFLLMAGIGFDAEVARRVERGPFKRLGMKLVNYLATTGRLTVTHQPTKVWMRTEGHRRSVNALMILVGNTRLYGGAMTFAKQAVADDGWLDLVIMGNGSVLYRAGLFLRAAFSRTSLGPRVRYARCRTVRFESNTPLPVQVDGEVIGTLPMTFSVAPLALTVIVPKDAPAELFSRPPLAALPAPEA
jgi:diacylglycerol kinase (ATP)